MNHAKRNLWLLLAMLITAGAAFGLTPRHKIAEHNPMPLLEELIPKQFGQWAAVPGSNQIVDPGQQVTLNKIYDQTLSRTYENAQGYRIMLSMAYGGNQRDELELHKPEVCYVAQGFVLTTKSKANILVSSKSVPVTQLNLTHSNRVEPVTYWATVGDTVVNDGYAKKIVELRYGLTGQIPDGVLVRISSLDTDQTGAYSWHLVFANELLTALPEPIRIKLLGDS